MEINGIAHTFVTAGDFARARDFYAQLLPFLGMKCVLDGEGFYYCVGGRTAFGVRGPDLPNTSQLTDDAGLGTTAVWSSVTGLGKPADYATQTKIFRQPTAPADGTA